MSVRKRRVGEKNDSSGENILRERARGGRVRVKGNREKACGVAVPVDLVMVVA